MVSKFHSSDDFSVHPLHIVQTLLFEWFSSLSFFSSTPESCFSNSCMHSSTWLFRFERNSSSLRNLLLWSSLFLLVSFQTQTYPCSITSCLSLNICWFYFHSIIYQVSLSLLWFFVKNLFSNFIDLPIFYIVRIVGVHLHISACALPLYHMMQFFFSCSKLEFIKLKWLWNLNFRCNTNSNKNSNQKEIRKSTLSLHTIPLTLWETTMKTWNHNEDIHSNTLLIHLCRSKNS